MFGRDKINRNIAILRDYMRKKEIDALILLVSDPHNSEYIAERWKSVEFLTSYTGEGLVLVTDTHLGLWTDSRYFIQAERELYGIDFELHPTRCADSVTISQYLVNLRLLSDKNTFRIAVDGTSTPYSFVQEIHTAFSSISDLDYFDDNYYSIINIPDFIEEIWEDRPVLPTSPILHLSETLTGRSREDKLSFVVEAFKKASCKAVLVSALDDIAWILNIRASDIHCNPVAISYLLITEDEVKWYVQKSPRFDEESLQSINELREDGIKVLNYNDIAFGLSYCVKEGNYPIMVDSASLNYSLYTLIEPYALLSSSVVALEKAIKNDVEVQGMREAHIEDGIALEKFLYWLEGRVSIDDGLSEYEAASKLHSLRAESSAFRGESFDTISAYTANAALPHYLPSPSNSATLAPYGLYLCDSGAHYLYGTTDVTRTIPLGKCTSEEREDYTLVLKGHIALARAVFPKGTAGCHLDILARNPLWLKHRNYGHGTGHGVGYFLNVHEGPQSIRQDFNKQAILEGMVVSNEPAMYVKSRYGIRHENLLLCKKSQVNEFGEWLEFEVLTLCHIDTSILELSLMTADEIEWLNNYNQRVYNQLSEYMPANLKQWLREKTKAINM